MGVEQGQEGVRAEFGPAAMTAIGEVVRKGSWPAAEMLLFILTAHKFYFS
jgi:hypothetical protein